MNKKSLLILWSVLFIVCAGLGFIPQPEGILKTVLFVVSLLFFVPPAFLLYLSVKKQDRDCLLLIRNLSALSLLTTLVLMVLNILSALWPAAAGNFLYSVLTIVSSPMICCGNWFLSMFLWACLLITAMQQLRK